MGLSRIFPSLSFVFLTFQLSTFNLQPASSSNSFPFIHLRIYIDKYYQDVVISCLIVERQIRSFTPTSPRNLCVLSVSALDSSSSFVFLNFQLLTLNVQPSLASNSFPHNSLSDPHPLNPVVSILYKKQGGRGFVIPSKARDLLFPTSLYFITSLLLYVVTSKSERLDYVP
jgi:hypothetical protein